MEERRRVIMEERWWVIMEDSTIIIHVYTYIILYICAGTHWNGRTTHSQVFGGVLWSHTDFYHRGNAYYTC